MSNIRVLSMCDVLKTLEDKHPDKLCIYDDDPIKFYIMDHVKYISVQEDKFDNINVLHIKSINDISSNMLYILDNDRNRHLIQQFVC